MHAKLRGGGLLVASVRDYDALLRDRPRFMSEQVLGDGETRRVLFHAWDWAADARYRHGDLADAVRRTGFANVRWLEPAESGYYQPLLLADARDDAAM